ncbi:uncharacterized protein LOC100375106 [Saccoglossus kowalevskii]|uniref:Uncharacterized protein LOC100375106 n=1 Tax=Saccoglossus kowalevskii TaxID=10224 RepID=A0ABM0H0V3_SACKO|nr:PREDICTED: uncharacterized protein LOC100375106 [Saccoglossus kowalevskii]
MGCCTSSDGEKVDTYQCVDDMQENARATSIGRLAFIHDTQQLYIRVEDGWKIIQLGAILSLPPTPMPTEKTEKKNKSNGANNKPDNTTKVKKAKTKEKKVSKLEIKETKVAGVDKMFKEAVAPFNGAVELKEQIDKTIETFKVSTGHKKDDSIKVIILDLKRRYPDLSIEIQDGCKFVLDFGSYVKEEDGDKDDDDDGDDVERELIKVEIEEDNVVKAFSAIGDLGEKMMDLLKKAKESAQIFEQSKEITAMVKDSGLNGFQLAKALKNAASNISEFRKVPSVIDALMKTVSNLVEDVKDTIKELKGEIEVEIEVEDE